MSRRKKSHRCRMSAKQYSWSGALQQAWRNPYRAYQRLIKRYIEATKKELVPVPRDVFEARWRTATAAVRLALCQCFIESIECLFVRLRKQYYSASTQTIFNSQVAEDVFWGIYHLKDKTEEG